MEETTTSWKNHSFTLLVFGGIVVLSSIFFVLGMLVGRQQGQRIAESAFAAEAEKKPVAANVDDFKLNYYSETTEEKPDLKLQPAPEPAAPSPPLMSAAPSSGASSTARPPAFVEKAPAVVKPPSDVKTQKLTKAPSVKDTVARAPAPDRVQSDKTSYWQITSTKNEKQAVAEQKKVESKGFSARVLKVKLKNEFFHRVLVGPYRESELDLAKADLTAEGYRPVVPQK